jgi:hypothetical protein
MNPKRDGKMTERTDTQRELVNLAIQQGYLHSRMKWVARNLQDLLDLMQNSQGVLPEYKREIIKKAVADLLSAERDAEECATEFLKPREVRRA